MGNARRVYFDQCPATYSDRQSAQSTSFMCRLSQVYSLGMPRGCGYSIPCDDYKKAYALDMHVNGMKDSRRSFLACTLFDLKITSRHTGSHLPTNHRMPEPLLEFSTCSSRSKSLIANNNFSNFLISIKNIR